MVLNHTSNLCLLWLSFMLFSESLLVARSDDDSVVTLPDVLEQDEPTTTENALASSMTDTAVAAADANANKVTSGSNLRHRRLTAETDKAYNERLQSQLSLFRPVPEVQVLGPSSFPKPTDKVNVESSKNQKVLPYMQPIHGTHRPDQDAVFAYAAEYGLNNYMCFVQSLRDTGFTGDIVLSVSQLDVQNTRVWNYLKSVPNLVVYAPNLVCFNFEQEQVASAKGGMRTCQCPDLYGVYNNNDKLQAVPDPRSQRVIATVRYEIYWIMAQHYHPHSWILLVDARDTFFQSNPFVDVPRKTDPSQKSGLLYFFGEHIQATRLGQSKSNRKWLQTAYGDKVADALKDQPTICSGATMGEQVALETYVKAMVAEADDTGTVLMGADQGFHNFLYYSQKLVHAQAIHAIVVFDQGTGIVNNMGAMRTQPLAEWGNGKIVVHKEVDDEDDYRVLNWDGTLSPVVHQFDRHKELSDYFFKKRTNAMLAEWKKRQQQH